MYPWVPLVDLQSSTSTNIFATPKSESRRYPLACKRIFSGFISDTMMYESCRRLVHNRIFRIRQFNQRLQLEQSSNCVVPLCRIEAAWQLSIAIII